jgi:hypothetical protein
VSAWIVNQRTGKRLGPFRDYGTAATFRKDVLRPQLRPNTFCPYAIRVDDDAPAAPEALS